MTQPNRTELELFRLNRADLPERDWRSDDINPQIPFQIENDMTLHELRLERRQNERGGDRQ